MRAMGLRIVIVVMALFGGGLAYGAETVQTLVPDVFVRHDPEGVWIVELNSDTLPKVLVNQRYFAEVSATVNTNATRRKRPQPAIGAYSGSSSVRRRPPAVP